MVTGNNRTGMEQQLYQPWNMSLEPYQEPSAWIERSWIPSSIPAALSRRAMWPFGNPSQTNRGAGDYANRRSNQRHGFNKYSAMNVGTQKEMTPSVK